MFFFDNFPSPQMEAARKELNKELESEATGGNADEKVSLVQMLRTPNLRVNALLCTVIWSVNQPYFNFNPI